MAGSDFSDDTGAHRERPDELDLADLSRRQRIGGRSDYQAALDATGARLPDTTDTPPLRPTVEWPSQARHERPIDIRSTPPVQAESAPATPPVGRRENIEMHQPDLQSLADTRNLQRGVVPTPGVDLQAHVTPGIVSQGSLGSYAVGVRKISNAGIIIVVSAADHSALSPHEDLWLALKLPSRRQSVRIATHVRHRLSDGSDYVYGCEFDWSSTTDPLGIAEDLLDFVLETGED